MHTILIADSGSTKTDWILVSEEGTRLKQCTSQGLNPFFQSEIQMMDIIQQEVYVKLLAKPDEIYFYGAGCTDKLSKLPIRGVLEQFCQHAKIEIESDLLGAARSTFQQDMGIACILGTGANNCIYDGSQVTGNIGSLGFWLGDEGSGGYLGKQLVIAFLQKELPSDLEVRFRNTFPAVNRMEILDRAYKQPNANRYFATFTPFIKEHISHPYLVDLVKQAFELFVRKYVLKHTGFLHHQVSFIGSVAMAFREILIDVLLNNGLVFGRIAQSPMEGLAQFHAGRCVG